MSGIETTGLFRWFQPAKILPGAILATLAAVVILFIITVGHKLYVEARARRLRTLTGDYESGIRSTILNARPDVKPPRTPLEFEAYGEAVLRVFPDMKDDQPALLREQVRRFGLDAFYRERALSPSWVHRFSAVEKLGALKMEDLRLFFRDIMARERHHDVLAQTVLALSRIVQDDGDLGAINAVLVIPYFKSSKFAEYIYENIIRTFVASGREPLFLRYLASLMSDDGVPVLLKKDIIEACGSARLMAAKNTIINSYVDLCGVPEMRIVCIRALGRLGGDDMSRIISTCLRDEDWRVRVVAAKNAYFSGTAIISDIRKCLHDKNYYVRMNAAVSLSLLGKAGIAVLSEEKKSGDRFTRDVSKYILREVRIRG
ncbi:MAG TPA: HEAT repeat domain-containing protein [Dissulfurispiraceae bacterium]|nr:HEAT repeat domain-containing protein [Dissulfurispiraceae bacterium]